MDDKKKFSKEDKQKVIEFLNMVALKADFNMKTTEIVKYYHLLSHMQKEIIPKIEDHIMEITRVIEPKEE